MKTLIKQILPRQTDDGPVMNVSVVFLVPEKEHRNNTVETTVFIDKNIESMADISRLSVEKSIEVLKTIIKDHTC